MNNRFQLLKQKTISEVKGFFRDFDSGVFPNRRLIDIELLGVGTRAIIKRWDEVSPAQHYASFYPPVWPTAVIEGVKRGGERIGVGSNSGKFSPLLWEVGEEDKATPCEEGDEWVDEKGIFWVACSDLPGSIGWTTKSPVKIFLTTYYGRNSFLP